MNPDKDVEVELQLGEMFANMAVRAEGEEPIPVLEMALAIVAPVTVGANEEGNAIGFSIGLPTISLDVLSSDFLLPDAFLETFLPTLVSLVLPIVGAFLDDFPIPSFEGYSVNITELTAIGQGYSYLGAYGTLVADVPDNRLLEPYLW